MASPDTKTTEDVATTLPEVAETVTSTVWSVWEDFLKHSPFIVAGIALLILTWLLAKAVRAVVRRSLKKSSMRSSLKDLMIRFAIILVWAAGLMLTAIVIFPDVSPSKVIGGLGLFSVAVGFAFKDIFENFFAGIMLLWRYPIEPGDFIDCEDVHGRIIRINVRMTEIRRGSGELVVVPNSWLYSNVVDVLTDRKKRRVALTIGVDYDADVQESMDVIEKAVKSCGTVLENEPLEVVAKSFGASSIDIDALWWTGSEPREQRASVAEVIVSVKKALEGAGIEIPFIHQTLTFKEPLELKGDIKSVPVEAEAV